MCVFTQTQPKSSRAAIRDAVLMLLVHTDDASAYSLSLENCSASSSSVNFWTVSTGPKISVRISSSVCSRSATMVGS